MATYLDRIVTAHREAAAADRRSLEELAEAARSQPPVRGFQEAVRRSGSVAVISEVKRRSPSKGDLAPGLDPARLARDYARGGATCLSVLTDDHFFGGSAADLAAARAAVELPVLRKDFTVCVADVYDARIMGADCLLLIVAALDAAEMADLHAAAVGAGLDVLVEVHDEAEAEVALDIGAEMIGINQRDLYTFEVDTDRAVRVAAALPAPVVSVAESGIRDGDDVRRLADAGFDAVLVGETLVRAADPAAALAELRRSPTAIS
jgi:indole-3-glycerol phosphate synthase